MTFNKQILQTLKKWLQDAKTADPTGYNAMSLATCTKDGHPSCRIVLLKDVDEDGIVFFTNFESRKGDELKQNPAAASTFFWPTLQRQVRIEGSIEKVTDRESEAYFKSRPHLSQVASAVSEQSRPIESFEALEELFANAQQKHQKEIERPDHWGGFRIRPHAIEFWEAKDFRLHKRRRYTLNGNNWECTYLQP